MTYRSSLLFFLLILLVFPQMEVRAQSIPLMIPHSGVVTINGTLFSGSGQFKFAIVNTDSSVTFWTNDNTHLDGAVPTSAVILSVTNGAFAVKVGDVALGMTPIPKTLFANNPDTFLRVWFNDGVTGFQELLPKRQLVSVPYAYKAEVAEVANSTPGSSGVEFTSSEAPFSLENAEKILLTITLTAPIQGFSILTGSGVFRNHHANSDNLLEICLSNVTGPCPDSQRTITDIPSGSVSGIYDVPFSLSHVFSVSAGENTFFMTGRRFGNDPSGEVLNAHLQAIFVPVRY